LQRCDAPTRDRLRQKFEKLKADPFDPRNSKPLVAGTIGDRRESGISESYSWCRASTSSLRRSALAARSTSTGIDRARGPIYPKGDERRSLSAATKDRRPAHQTPDVQNAGEPRNCHAPVTCKRSKRVVSAEGIEPSTVLVQRQVESGRSPLASITPFRRASLGGHLPTHWRVVERAAAETATGFKKENMLGGPCSHGRAWM